MYKYTVFECKDCKHRQMYPSNIADGHKCKVCGSTIYIPIDTGLKVEMQGKYNIAYEPRQGREVTTTEYELLLKRFRHLMKSETIASYDEVDPRTGEYKRDIKELDKRLRGADGCTPLTIFIMDEFIEQGYTEQLKEFLLGVIDDAIFRRQKELGL